jgi:hypothetical protein
LSAGNDRDSIRDNEGLEHTGGTVRARAREIKAQTPRRLYRVSTADAVAGDFRLLGAAPRGSCVRGEGGHGPPRTS